MYLLDQLAEQKIAQHLEQQNPSDNRFCGQALDFSQDAHVPAEVRALYRVLKHNGFVPAEVAIHKEIQNFTQLLNQAVSEEERGLAAKRLQLLNAQLEMRGRSLSVRPMAEYQQQLVRQMDANREQGAL